MGAIATNVGVPGMSFYRVLLPRLLAPKLPRSPAAAGAAELTAGVAKDEGGGESAATPPGDGAVLSPPPAEEIVALEGASADTGAALAERVTVEPAASDQLSMLSRRMEMIERSVMWSNRRRPSSSSGDEPKAAGGKRKQQEKKRGGRPRIEESLEPTHSAGVVATRMQMDGPLASIEEHDANEGDQHEAQTRLSRRWSAPVSARQRVLKSRRRRQTQNRQQARRRGEKEEG